MEPMEDGIGEFAIGFGDGNPPAPDLARIRVARATDVAAEELRHLHAATLAIIDGCIAECHNDLSSCEVCIHGAIDRKIDVCEAVLRQIEAKILQHIDMSGEMAVAYLDNVYAELMPPELLHGEQTVAAATPQTQVDFSQVQDGLRQAAAEYQKSLNTPTRPTIGDITSDVSLGGGSPTDVPTVVAGPTSSGGGLLPTGVVNVDATNPPPRTTTTAGGGTTGGTCTCPPGWTLLTDPVTHEQYCYEPITRAKKPCTVTPPPPVGGVSIGCGDITTKLEGFCCRTPEAAKLTCGNLGGEYTPNTNGDGGVCHLANGEDVICRLGVDGSGGGNPPPPGCMKSVSDCNTFIQTDKSGNWSFAQTPNGKTAIYNKATQELIVCDGTSPPCAPGGPPAPFCPRPDDAPDDARLLVRDDGSAQWVDDSGKTYGCICPPDDCPKPVDAPADAKVYTFSDGKRQWFGEDGTAYGDVCDAPNEELCKPAEPGELDPIPEHTTRKDWSPYIVCDMDGYKDYQTEPIMDVGAAKILYKEIKERYSLKESSVLVDVISHIPFIGGFIAVIPQPSKVYNWAVNWFAVAVAAVGFDPRAIQTGHLANSFWMSGVFKWVNRLFPLPATWSVWVERWLSYDIQSGTPSTPELHQARLRKCIDEKQWKHGLKLNGDCIPWAEKMYAAQTEYVPGPQDLVHFMVRDVFDDTVVEDLDLSAEFDDKFTDKAKKIAEKQGISEDTMLRYWQSHWQNLSPGQVYEMMHRLAPDQEAEAPDGTPVEFTPEQAEKLLKIADLPPAMIKNLMAISYRPVMKRDIRALYVTGQSDREDVIKLFRQIGYTPENAEKQAKALERIAADERLKFMGYDSLNESTKQFRSGAMSENDFRAVLQSGGVPDDNIQQYIDNNVARRKAEDAVVMLRAARNAFLRGRLSESEYRDELNVASVDSDRIHEIIGRDTIVKRNSNRQYTLAQLCKLASQGYLQMSEYTKRAENLGFEAADAAILAQSCATEIIEKRAKEQEQQQRKGLQAAEKARKERQRQQRELHRYYRETFGCAPRSKAPCPPGVRIEPLPPQL